MLYYTSIVRSVAGLSDLDKKLRALSAFTDVAAASAVVIGLRVTRNPTLTVNLACWAVSTGSVLNRRSLSAKKY